MQKPDNNLLFSSELIPYPKTNEYSNEFDEDASIPSSQPNLYVPTYYNLENDVEYLQNGDFWTYVHVCIHRPAKHREMLTKKLLQDYWLKWFEIMKPYIFVQSISNELNRYTFEAFKISGPGLDVYFLNNILNPKSSFLGKPSIQLKALAEILCTRSFEQIVEIKKKFFEVYEQDLSDSVCTKLKGSARTFFYNVLNMRRYSVDDSYEVDIQLFTDVIFYKKNKKQLIEIFSRRSYSDIRKICLNCMQNFEIDITCKLYVYEKSMIQKCALVVGRFIYNQANTARIKTVILQAVSINI
ncbi:hypothetical protein RF11_12365 [Thelohanellus kitauei]|uniref:Uncharacterized protein n=1 Tax=Thelohanellus kitauei TaxID=669202 RepID=A0A0C2JU32_THEKT|nr:hypothetical protein RF11_12365 [Thelohanellus kitauei]